MSEICVLSHHAWGVLLQRAVTMAILNIFIVIIRHAVVNDSSI